MEVSVCQEPKVVKTSPKWSEILYLRSQKSSLASKLSIRKSTNIDSLKAELKNKRAALKSVEKEVGKLKAKKAKEDQEAAEAAKKAEAETVLKKLLANGMSAEEILAKLK